MRRLAGLVAAVGVGGCVDLVGPAGRVRFPGDGSALASSLVVSGRTS